jgi:hypothetical protein
LIDIPTRYRPTIVRQKKAAGSQRRILIPQIVEAEAGNPIGDDRSECRGRRGMLRVPDVAGRVPFRSAPACSDRDDINGPALRIVCGEQCWIVLSVSSASDEQSFATTAPNSRD